MRTLLTTTAALTAMLLASGLSLSAHAQTTNPPTDQTDQSEEDWRKSRKKRSTPDIFGPGPSSIGSGAPIVDYKPVTAVERLPSDSRRHLMRERAKAIAEDVDGDISDAAFKPSDSAKTDSALEADEREAWAEITGGSGSGSPDATTQPSSGQASSGADAGDRSGDSSDGEGGSSGQPAGDDARSQGPRGGSTASLQQIMDAIKSGQPVGAASRHASRQDRTQSGGGSQNDGKAAQDNPAEQGQVSGQSQDGALTGAQSQSEGDDQGSSQDGQSSDGGSASASAQNAGQHAAQDDAQTGQDGDTSGSEGNAADPASPASRASEPLSPLERIRRTREERPAEGSQRSASDYIDRTPDR